jgi:hypothetical protein
MRTSSAETRERTAAESVTEFLKIWQEWAEILWSVGITPPDLYPVTEVVVPESTLVQLHNAVAAAESQMRYIDPFTLAERIEHDHQSLLEDEFVVQITRQNPAATR